MSAEDYISANSLSALTESLGIDLELDDLADLLMQIETEPSRVDFAPYTIPEAMQGLGGFVTTLALQKVVRVDENGDFDVSGDPIADKVLYGKIRDYTYVKETQSGHISVDMCTDPVEFVPVGEDRREFWHWDVEIPEGGFEVFVRNEPGMVNDPATYPDMPFDVDVPLPAAATDPTDPGSIWRRNLNHKLHASGERIEVRHVFHRKLSEPNLVRLPAGSAVYNSTAASCVDLFTDGFPPATFAELPPQRGYCLGRCAHPAIYNSGD